MEKHIILAQFFVALDIDFLMRRSSSKITRNALWFGFCDCCRVVKALSHVVQWKMLHALCWCYRTVDLKFPRRYHFWPFSLPYGRRSTRISRRCICRTANERKFSGLSRGSTDCGSESLRTGSRMWLYNVEYIQQTTAHNIGIGMDTVYEYMLSDRNEISSRAPRRLRIAFSSICKLCQ